MAALILLSVLVLVLGRTDALPGVKTSETFNQSAVLDTDGNYILFWNFNETSITFEVHVRTRGWVGFGISPNGNMYPADVVVGWVTNNGTAHFADRHTTAHRMPVMDKSQDWTLLFSEENEFGTVLKFTRKIRTCDRTEDLDIPEGTVRVIYAYHTDDPAADDAIMYHGTRRGTKSLYLLSQHVVPAETKADDVKHFDFLAQNFLMPNDTTRYQCRGFLMPAIGKHYMIKYEPIVTPGNELNVHHIVLYRCNVPHPVASNGVSGNCYEGRPKELPQCGSIVVAWAIGGKAFYFPENVGFPIGDPSEPSFYIMETHYDNPTRRTGVIDNSGIRITLTRTPRQYEAALLELGAIVNINQVIPPNNPAFLSKGYCSESCLKKGMAKTGLTEMKVFGALQHAHLLGVGIKTRHFRNGTELKPLMNDPDYDFDFQETRLLPKEVSVYPGDSFIVECTYDSTGRSRPTFGGLSTQEEMCLTFMYYYPKTSLDFCMSMPTYQTYTTDYSQLYKIFTGLDWSNQTVVDDFQHKLDGSGVYQSCMTDGFVDLNGGTPEWYFPPMPTSEYVPPPPACT